MLSPRRSRRLPPLGAAAGGAGSPRLEGEQLGAGLKSPSCRLPNNADSSACPTSFHSGHFSRWLLSSMMENGPRVDSCLFLRVPPVNQAKVPAVMRKRYLITGLVVLAGILWMLRRFSVDAGIQHFQTAGFWQTVAGANHMYLLVSAVAIGITYALRAYRWQTMLRPTRDTNFYNVLVGTLIGFAGVGVIGRPAELLRPYLIARKEGMAVSSQLGAWTLERILDSLAIVALLGLSLWLWPPEIAAGSTASHLLAGFQRAGSILLLVTLAAGIVLTILHYWPSIARSVLNALIRPLPEKLRGHLHSIFDHFISALAVIGDLPNLLRALSSTALVWFCVLVSYWAAAQSLGEPVSSIRLGGLTLVMLSSGLGSMAHLPAVGGGIQIATVLSLTHLFNIPLPVATSMALFVWVITYLLVLIPALPLAAREGISWRNFSTLPQSTE